MILCIYIACCTKDIKDNSRNSVMLMFRKCRSTDFAASSSCFLTSYSYIIFRFFLFFTVTYVNKDWYVLVLDVIHITRVIYFIGVSFGMIVFCRCNSYNSDTKSCYIITCYISPGCCCCWCCNCLVVSAFRKMALLRLTYTVSLNRVMWF